MGKEIGDGTGYITKDSGERQQFETGAKRDSRSGKGRFDLLPPTVIRRDAGLYERGADKYGSDNWKSGMPSSRYMESLLRHAFQYLYGDRTEDHLAAIRFNAGGIMYNEDCIPDLDDLTIKGDINKRDGKALT